MCQSSKLQIWLAAPSLREGWTRECLNNAELAVFEGFRSSQAKASYLWAHVLLRSALTDFLPGTAPGAWQFARTGTGRPVVTGADEPPCFSLSHTLRLVGCSVAAGVAHGLDVVDIDQQVEPVERIALSREERAQLAYLPPAAKRERLATLWALKEAYVKARGVGLALPVERVSFGFGAEGIEATFGRAIRDDPMRWWFGVWRPTAESVLALTVERVGERIPSFTWRQMSYENLTRAWISVPSPRPPLLASTPPWASVASP
jgi:4'-phosphopantetheinyl transferase